MKFGKRFENSKIPEWADFYVSYRILKKLLSPYKIMTDYYLKSKIDNNALSIHNFTAEDIQRLDYFGSQFERLIFQDLEKVLAFYTIKLTQIITKWRKLRINIIIYKQRNEQLALEAKDEFNSMLRESFQALIKEVKLLNDYITVNLEGFQKILKKQQKAVKTFAPKSDLKLRFEKYLAETKTSKARDRLNNFLVSIENEYVDFFYKNRSEGLKELRKIFQGNLISRNETFWFGLFLGFSALLIFVISILIWDEDLDVDGNQIFTEIFPIFRGIGLIIMFLWLLALNVYVWTSYHVNYKLIFRFNYHYSQLSEILTRASVFTTIFLIVLLWYLLLEGKTGKLHDMLSFVPKEVLPLIVWICFIGYVFFPHPKMFNGQGRMYFFKLVKNIFSTPFMSVNFPIIWATDQLASFVVPLKDLGYTICYYSTYFFSDRAKVEECRQPAGFNTALMLAFVPLILRFLQCLRQGYDAGSFKIDATVNSMKYLFSVFVSIFSYLVSVYSGNTTIFNLWIAIAMISTFFSYAWDLKKDWGFLVPGAKYKLLRNELSYNKPTIYYVIMSTNLIMRLAWVLNISPDIMSNFIRPEFFALIIGLTELIRRAVWNFLRVEKEHLANVGNFKAVPDMNLPFPNIAYDGSLKEEEVFSQDLRIMIETENKNRAACASEHNSRKGSIRPSSFHQEKIDLNSILKFAPEGEDFSKLKQLSKITLEPMSALKTNKDSLVQDLANYRSQQPQFETWAKEIKQFRQYVMEKANKFFIVPAYKEMKLFSTKSRVLDSPREHREYGETPTVNLLKRAISKRNFTTLYEKVIEEDDGNKKSSQSSSQNENDKTQLGDLKTFKKMSFEGRDDPNQIPLLLEMKQQYSQDPSKHDP